MCGGYVREKKECLKSQFWIYYNGSNVFLFVISRELVYIFEAYIILSVESIIESCSFESLQKLIILIILCGFEATESITDAWPFLNFIIKDKSSSLIQLKSFGSTVRYCFIVFHFPNSVNSVSGFEIKFKIMLQNY